MIYSTETVEKIQDCASNLMTITDIAALLMLDEDELREQVLNKNSEISKIYRQAKAETIFTIRKQEIILAKASSPLGIEMCAGYINDMEDDEHL